MTLSGVDPWHLDNHESRETCTVCWLMKTAAGLSLISASRVSEMISQRIFPPVPWSVYVTQDGKFPGDDGDQLLNIHVT